MGCFDHHSANARKTSGSYYTPSCLVEEQVKSTIDPLIKKRLAGKTSDTDREAAILSLAILDPACGSAHFLLAAARRVAETLAKIRAGEPSSASSKRVSSVSRNRRKNLWDRRSVESLEIEASGTAAAKLQTHISENQKRNRVKSGVSLGCHAAMG